MNTNLALLNPAEQPKWEKLTRGGLEYHIYKEFEGKIFGRVKTKKNEWYAASWSLNGSYLGTETTPYDLIPYNPRKTELLSKKEQLEKELEEINKELEQ